VQHDFCPARLPNWDHLLMDQDDPEKRIAELERQLADARAAGDPGASRGYPATGGWLTPEQVHNMAFAKPPIGKRGYNEHEVDAFLDLVEEQLKSQQAAPDLAEDVVGTPPHEEPAASKLPARFQLIPAPAVWKRRPPLAIDVGKDAVWVIDAKTNALVCSGWRAEVTATPAQYTQARGADDDWGPFKTDRYTQPLLVVGVPGLKTPLIIGTPAMRGHFPLQFRFSWRGQVYQDREPLYLLHDAEWFALVRNSAWPNICKTEVLAEARQKGGGS
jgi:DivIVA domain-containing protein